MTGFRKSSENDRLGGLKQQTEGPSCNYIGTDQTLGLEITVDIKIIIIPISLLLSCVASLLFCWNQVMLVARYGLQIKYLLQKLL